MAKRITAMVNEVLAEEEPGTKALTEDDVLALIDTGGSEGGPQVCLGCLYLSKNLQLIVQYSKRSSHFLTICVNRNTYVWPGSVDDSNDSSAISIWRSRRMYARALVARSLYLNNTW